MNTHSDPGPGGRVDEPKGDAGNTLPKFFY